MQIRLKRPKSWLNKKAKRTGAEELRLFSFVRVKWMQVGKTIPAGHFAAAQNRRFRGEGCAMKAGARNSWAYDLAADLAGGVCYAVGMYVFAMHADLRRAACPDWR